MLPALIFSSPALITPPPLITPLLANTFPNKFATNAATNITRNPPFSSLASFTIIYFFINK